MTFQKFYLAFLLIFFVGLGAYFIFHSGYYTIAFVNGTVITARSLHEMYVSAFHYYGTLLKNNNGDLENIREDFKQGLQLQVLNQLIERILVSRGVKNAVGKDLQELVDAKLAIPKLQEANFQEAVKTMYGLDAADFKETILIPQAYREILEGRLTLENKNLDGWLTEARKLAKVTILMGGFTWQGGELTARD